MLSLRSCRFLILMCQLILTISAGGTRFGQNRLQADWLSGQLPSMILKCICFFSFLHAPMFSVFLFYAGCLNLWFCSKNDSNCVIFQKRWMFLIHALHETQKTAAKGIKTKAAVRNKAVKCPKQRIKVRLLCELLFYPSTLWEVRITIYYLRKDYTSL